MRRRLDRVGPAFTTQVQQTIDTGRLDDTFIDALCDPPEVFTYAGMIAHVLTFAAYNRNFTTKTFFKPNSADYFQRQPGKPVRLRHAPPKP